jgi:hypothetical protein
MTANNQAVRRVRMSLTSNSYSLLLKGRERLISYETLRHAARSLAPFLIALTFATVAHAQGTMDFSGAQTLMGTFKTFAVSATSCFHASHTKSACSRSSRVSRKEASFRSSICTGSCGSSDGIEGMILHSIPPRNHNGASHRKNIDTPSLTGCC